MSKTRFTPGPWAYRPHEFDDWGVVKTDKFTICQARDQNQLDDDILNQHRRAGTDPWEANARLIAAAPDLYECLEQATAMLRVLVPSDIPLRETLAYNEKILAKARGEE